jgi:hypothetical protein
VVNNLGNQKYTLGSPSRYKGGNKKREAKGTYPRTCSGLHVLPVESGPRAEEWSLGNSEDGLEDKLAKFYPFQHIVAIGETLIANTILSIIVSNLSRPI